MASLVLYLILIDLWQDEQKTESLRKLMRF